MAKNNKNQEVVFVTETETEEVKPVEVTVAATPAVPHEETSNVTVFKPVGTGGPVPIVAPKNKTIQLQPIVIPLAVVPYMTQDNSVLRTDPAPRDAKPEAVAEFEAAESVKVKKRRTGATRLFALASFLLSAAVALIFVLPHFVAKGTSELDIVAIIKGYVANGFDFSPVSSILYIASAAFSAALCVCMLISCAIGKYPRAFSGLFSFASAGCLVAELVIGIVNKSFVPGDRTAFIVALCVATLSFVASVVFSFVLNKLEDRAEEAMNFKVI